MNKHEIIQSLFKFSDDIRYVAIYHQNQLVFEARENTSDPSSAETDRFEELLVNPTILTLTRQRGNIDCGGLRHIIVGYGNFNQLVTEILDGHMSICLEKSTDLNNLPNQIYDHLNEKFPDFI